MSTRSDTLRTVLTTLLTVWMTAVSLSVWVRHAHEGASVPHVHGWGWCPGSSTKAGSSPPTEPEVVHRHLLFIGIECQNEPPAERDTPDAPADGVSVIDGPCERPTPAGMPDLGDTLLPAPFPPAPPSNTPPAERGRFVSRHLPLSMFACRQVSGVLRS